MPIQQKRRPKLLKSGLLFALLLLALAETMRAEETREPEGVGVDRHEGQAVPLDLPFRDENGEQRLLRDFFADRRRPVVLVPAYFTCPRLCSYVFQGVAEAMNKASEDGLAPGRDYQVVSISFDPRDTPDRAAQKAVQSRARVTNPNGAPIDPSSWVFLTGPESSIKPVMDAIGYRYRTDGETDFTHTAAIALITPEAQVARYLFGVRFAERDFRLGLVEASRGRIGGTTDQILLYCFRYDSVEGKYTPFAMAFVRIGAGITLLVLAGAVFFLLRRERNT